MKFQDSGGRDSRILEKLKPTWNTQCFRTAWALQGDAASTAAKQTNKIIITIWNIKRNVESREEMITNQIQSPLIKQNRKQTLQYGVSGRLRFWSRISSLETVSFS